MLYHAFELTHAALTPLRAFCEIEKSWTASGLNPWAWTPGGRAVHAACQVFEGMTRRYGRPAWGIDGVEVSGRTVPVSAEVELCTAFCNLLHFVKEPNQVAPGTQPKLLIVMPLSGHYPTLLRGTVEALLPDHDVYVTDWKDARMVPASVGPFDLDDYIDTVIAALRYIGTGAHVVAVSQASVPALAVAALMAEDADAHRPRSLTLMGGPIDARVNPTPANQMTASRNRAWFEQTVISRVPFPHPGATRPVFPGFVTLSGFLFKNLERHVDAQLTYFNHLVEGDGETAAQHRAFYEEFLAVMDLPAEFFLQTVETVFQDFDLARGTFDHRGRRVDLAAVRDTALLTVEGGRDDICPPGQTAAAHALCPNIPEAEKTDHLHPGVGHYGVFNGRRWREEIAPRVAEFIGALSPR
ncbi:MAG: polyhydroxyalkanoate depolymerase [Magnetovibrio sp.]|nr:polyhydroxyalkanoate depolymerase [Magnetovibrio sp.]